MKEIFMRLMETPSATRHIVPLPFWASLKYVDNNSVYFVRNGRGQIIPVNKKELTDFFKRFNMVKSTDLTLQVTVWEYHRVQGVDTRGPTE